ncbi:MAG: tetratricopeptide repeat protein [Litorimonas sp.]
MKTYRLALLALGMTAFAGSAQAQLVVQGKGDAALCYDYSFRGNNGSRTAIETCSDALDQVLTKKDRAATLVNRGILHMRKGDQTAASADYDAAIAIQPNLTEAYVNYGASLIRQRKYSEALTALNTALEDTESSTRPEALYNRAIVMDQTDRYSEAYQDAKAALALRPDWKPALDLIDRYVIQPAG